LLLDKSPVKERFNAMEGLRASAVAGWRRRWKRRLWIVLVGCVAFLSLVLTQGIFYSADFTLKLEAFGGFFVLGCAILAMSRRSGRKGPKR
jgi:hypothetical protein